MMKIALEEHNVVELRQILFMYQVYMGERPQKNCLNPSLNLQNMRGFFIIVIFVIKKYEFNRNTAMP